MIFNFECNVVVIQVPCSSGSLLYVWCTLITIEPDTHMQQRVVSTHTNVHMPFPIIFFSSNLTV